METRESLMLKGDNSMARYLSLDMGAESGRLVIVDIASKISTEVLYRFETPITQRSARQAMLGFP